MPGECREERLCCEPKMAGSPIGRGKTTVALTETKLKALSAVWALALLGWIVLLAAEWHFTDGVACLLDPNISLYGTAQWSWLPPGRTCTWELAEGMHTDGPPTARLGILLLFSLWGATLLLCRQKEGSPGN